MKTVLVIVALSLLILGMSGCVCFSPGYYHGYYCPTPVVVYPSCH